MNQRFLGVFFIILIIFCQPLFVLAADDFVPLYNGKDLTGWRGSTELPLDPAAWQKMPTEKKEKLQKQYNEDMAKHWRADGDEIVNDGKGVFLTTEKDYGNFELHLEWMMKDHNTDSGIYLRGYPQVQIWDPASKKEAKNGAAKGSGALWNNKDEKNGRFPLVKADKPVGEWNTFDIKMVGNRVTIRFNGQLTVDNATLDNIYAKDGEPIVERGPIQLQTHGGEMRFRNIKIKELPAEKK
jgi:hypothetical protein